MSIISLCHEVYMDEHIQFLIKIDKEEAMFVKTLEEAKQIVNSLAVDEVKRKKTEGDRWIRVYREDTNDGRKVVIATRAIGIVYNGSLKRDTVFEIVPVGHAFFAKDLKSLQMQEEIQKRTREILLREGTKP